MKTKIEGAFAIAWVLTILVFAIDFIALHHVGLSMSPSWLSRFAKLFVVSALLCYGLCEIERIPRYKLLAERLRCRDLSIATLALLTIAVYGQAASIASYIAAAAGRPTVQDRLLAWEQALGFDWLKSYYWVSQFHGLQPILRIAYESAFFQMIGLCILFGLLRRRQELCEMVLIFVVSLAIVVPISAAFPAASPFVHFGIADPGTASQVSDFYRVRNGDLRIVDPFAIQGIVSLPSFHTVLALMLIYVMRNFRVLFGMALGINLVMLASTFSIGGHYLADIGSGALVGVVTIWWVRRWFSAYTPQKWPVLTN